jgi:hypothetical protein
VHPGFLRITADVGPYTKKFSPTMFTHESRAEFGAFPKMYALSSMLSK